MEAIAWTAIALLGTSVLAMVGSFYQLSSRIDALRAELGSRIDSLRQRVDGLGSRIDSLESRLDARLDGLSARLDDHFQRHAG